VKPAWARPVIDGCWVMTIRQSVHGRGHFAAVMFVLAGLAARRWIALVVFPLRSASAVRGRSASGPLSHQQAVRKQKVARAETCSSTRCSRERKIVKAFRTRGARGGAIRPASNRGLLSLALKDHRADELTRTPLMEKVLAAFGIMGGPSGTAARQVHHRRG